MLHRRNLKKQLRLGLPSTLIRHENGAFQKRWLKLAIFVWTESILKGLGHAILDHFA